MAMEIMMLPDQSVIATALLRPNWPDGQMIEDVLFIGLGTTEFGLRHARSLKNRFRNVPHKIATPSIPVLYLGGQTAPNDSLVWRPDFSRSGRHPETA